MTIADVSAAVGAGLRARRAEISRAIFVHVRDAMPERTCAEDAEYITGLRSAIAAMVEFGLMGIEHGDERLEPVPAATIAQTQRAARVGIKLEIVLRRYVAGYALLGDFVMQEAERGGLLGEGDALRHIQRTQALLLDRLIVAVIDEYDREVERAGRSAEQRQAELVLRLLAGGHVDSAELGYELAGWHTGLIAKGKRATEAVRRLAAALHCELLLVSRSEETVAACLGGRQRLPANEIERQLPTTWPAEVSVAIGEPGKGIEGLRLTHRQAQAALWVLLRRPQQLMPYVEVCLLAAALQDEVLGRSLVEAYLLPLSVDPVLCPTLREYIRAGRSASRAATTLGVVRQTVENRLRTAAKILGRELTTCLSELQLALDLEELGAFAQPPTFHPWDELGRKDLRP